MVLDCQKIHGANKGIDPHVQPGKQKSLPIQTVNKGTPTHPIPKPRIGQDRAGLRRKVNTLQPVLLPQQLPHSTNDKAYSKGSNAIA